MGADSNRLSSTVMTVRSASDHTIACYDIVRYLNYNTALSTSKEYRGKQGISHNYDMIHDLESGRVYSLYFYPLP